MSITIHDPILQVSMIVRRYNVSGGRGTSGEEFVADVKAFG